jgi:hypothetical protein
MPFVPEGFYALEQAVLRLAQQGSEELWDATKLTSAELRAYQSIGDTVHYQDLRKLLLGAYRSVGEPQGGIEDRLESYERAQRHLREALYSRKVRSVLQISQTGKCVEQESESWAQQTAASWLDDGRAFIPTGGVERTAFGPYVAGAPEELNYIEQPKGLWASILIEKESFDSFLAAVAGAPTEKSGGTAERGGPPGPRTRRGAPIQYDWDDAKLFVFQELDAHGDFAVAENRVKGWRSQNDLVSKLQEYMESAPGGGRAPSDSSAKKFVADCVAEWRTVNNSAT